MKPETIVQAACRAVEADFGGVQLVGSEGELGVHLPASAPAPAAVRGLVGLQTPATEQWLDDGELVQLLAAPIRADHTTAGVLYVCTSRPAGFQPGDGRVLAAFADLAAAALGVVPGDNENRRSAWLEASQDVTMALLGGAEPTEMLRLAARQALTAAGASAAAIARPAQADPTTLAFDIVEADELDPAPFIGLTVPLRGTASGQAFASGETVVVRDYGNRVVEQQEHIAATMIAAVKDIDSAVAVPLTVSGAGAGVLLVMRFNDASPFTREEVAHVEYFAQHAALALGFARAREDRERLAVLADRERIARDLHDLVIQRLFATGLGLAGLSRLVAEPELRTRLAGYLQELDHTVLELRTSIFAMRDTAPTRASLRAELWDLTRHAVDTLGFHPRVTFDGPIDFAVSNPHWDDILAVAREALANVARHAEATSATVDLAVDRHGRQLMLTITDDGVGVAEFPGRSSGLRNLAERAARWGGSVDVGRAEPRGTRMEWTIPLSDEPRQAEEGRP